jgi:protein-L-isoaspartate(D-aspartate) O-methyltransferase
MVAAKTTSPDKLARHRAEYAHDVSRRYGPPDPAVEAAFAKVPREAFLLPPPWRIGEGSPTHKRRWSKTSDPAKLYQDFLVSLNQEKGINNGQPSLHALCIAALRLSQTDHVLHIGTGTGYYTAIIAELAGSVDGYEVEPDLASRAAENLRPYPNVAIHAECATERALPDADAIYVSAGASRPDPFWLDALRDGGRLLFPLTGDRDWGGILLVERMGNGFAARFVSDCGFIPCAGARDRRTAARLTFMFLAGGKDTVRSLTREPPAEAVTWFAGDGWYLSTEPHA